MQKVNMLQERSNILKQMNQQYLKTSCNVYKIDSLFKPTDVIMPTNTQDFKQFSEILLQKVQSPLPQIIIDNDDETTQTQTSESDATKVFVNKRGSAGKVSDSTYCGTPDSQVQEKGD